MGVPEATTTLIGEQYRNMEMKHPREAEIVDIMQFLEYSIKPDASFNGTVCFQFVEPSESTTLENVVTAETEDIVYAVSTDSKQKKGN